MIYFSQKSRVTPNTEANKMTQEQKRRINTEIKRLEEKLEYATKTLNLSKENAKEDPDWNYWVQKDQMLVDHLNANISKLKAMLEA